MLRIAAEAQLGGFSLDVELAVGPGECLALAGPSGAGKSSVLRVIAGLVHPQHGTVTCGERVWLDTATNIDLPPDERRCGYVFQDYPLFPNLNAWQNVAYGLRGKRRDKRTRAIALLERFGVAHRAQERPRTLSGGGRQRVARRRAPRPRPPPPGARPRTPAARRAAVGARRPHPRRLGPRAHDRPAPRRRS